MADRRMDNGRDDHRTGQRPSNGTASMMGSTESPTPTRTPDVAPPGSRERSESDVTGYNPERDEDPSLRQGRFHRAAAMRMAQPRTSSGMATGLSSGSGMGMGGMGMGAGLNADTSGTGQRGGFGMTRFGHSDERDVQRGLGSGWDSRGGSDVRELGYGGGGMQQGPYGTDDRDDRFASGRGGSMRMGDQDTRHSLEMRRDTGGENYRPFDRSGYGGDDRSLREDRGQYSGGPYGNTGSYGNTGVYGNQPGNARQYGQSQGQGSRERYDPLLGMGHASPGQPGMGVNIGYSGTYTARGQDTGASTSGGTSTGTSGRRRWQREPLTAREIMTRNIKTVRRDSPLREVAQLMKDEDCGVVPIVDDKGTLVGIVTDRDLVIRAFTGGKTPDQLRAGDVMTDDVECVHPDESIHSVIEMMGKRQIRRVPVVERDDRVIGIISMGDIANRADYDEELQEALDRVSSKRSFWSRLT
jgi:CBS domain-containing protein